MGCPLRRCAMSTDRQAGTPQSLVLLLGSCLPILGAVLLAPLLPRIQSHFSDTPGVSILVPIALTIPALFVALLSPFAGFISTVLGASHCCWRPWCSTASVGCCRCGSSRWKQ